MNMHATSTNNSTIYESYNIYWKTVCLSWSNYNWVSCVVRIMAIVSLLLYAAMGKWWRLKRRGTRWIYECMKFRRGTIKGWIIKNVYSRFVGWRLAHVAMDGTSGTFTSINRRRPLTCSTRTISSVSSVSTK